MPLRKGAFRNPNSGPHHSSVKPYSLRDEWSPDGKVNTVLEAELIEISPVVFPAYLNGPVVAARSINALSPERLATRPVPVPHFPKLTRARNIIRIDED